MADGATIWRPAARIRPIAIGIAEHAGRMLLVRVPDDHGGARGYRPPGGGIEFMESAATALAREFREELSVEIAIGAGPLVIENRYDHHGAPGHEIVFVYRIRLLDVRLYGEERTVIVEDNGQVLPAEWLALDRFRSGELALFPNGLLARLAEFG